MLDINKAIDDRDLGSNDPDGHMHDLKPWSYRIAQNQARLEGMGDLSDGQWRVIHALRSLYRKNGRAESARQILQALERNFNPAGGRRALYDLFPDGPIAQGSRLAGVPAPP